MEQSDNNSTEIEIAAGTPVAATDEIEQQTAPDEQVDNAAVVQQEAVEQSNNTLPEAVLLDAEQTEVIIDDNTMEHVLEQETQQETVQCPVETTELVNNEPEVSQEPDMMQEEPIEHVLEHEVDVIEQTEQEQQQEQPVDIPADSSVLDDSIPVQNITATDMHVGDIVTCIYEFNPPSDSDQLHIVPGEEFEIIQECNDEGWVVGRNVVSNVQGAFPASYVTKDAADVLEGSGSIESSALNESIISVSDFPERIVEEDEDEDCAPAPIRRFSVPDGDYTPARRPAPPPIIRHESYAHLGANRDIIMKESHLSLRKGSISSSSVWAVLTPRALKIYKSKSKKSREGMFVDIAYPDEPKGTYELFEGDVASSDKKKKAFCVRLTDGREAIFSASTPEERNEWVEKIKTCIDLEKSLFEEKKKLNRMSEDKLEPVEEEEGGWMTKIKSMLSKMLKNRPSREELRSRNILQATVFGSPLKDVLELYNPPRKIPHVVEAVCERLIVRGIDEPGLFRESGRISDIQELRLLFNEPDTYPNLNDHKYEDAHVLTGVLKMFLREMPNPLMTFELYDEFIAIPSYPTREEKIQAMTYLVGKLPDEHFTLLAYLTRFLNEVSKHQSNNRMGAPQLAIVVAPNILRMKDDGGSMGWIKDMKSQGACVEMMISCYSEVFATIYET